MKFFHYSDRSSPDFLNLYGQSDVLVATGDLNLFDFAGLEDIKDRKPAFGVYGNHDSGTYFEPLGIINLHNQVYEFRGRRLGGFQGCLKYKPSDLMFTEQDAEIFAKTFPYVDILLLHAPPRGMLDDPTDPVHVGSGHIAKYILEKQPKIVFCGHLYSNAFTRVGTTVIYRTYGARLIEADLTKI